MATWLPRNMLIKKKKKIEFIIDLIAHFQANAEEENNIKYYNILKLSS